jgi:NADPH-dependent ferric siderophore reductase
MTAPLVRRSPVHRGRVLRTEQLAPRFRRVTIHCDAMVDVAIRPAQDVELHLREPSGRRVKRRYTIRHSRPDVGELDLDVFLHGDGPGSTWGTSAAAGDEVDFQGPRGKLELRSAPWHLLVGDESALPAIAAICEALPADERAIACIEVGDGDDELPRYVPGNAETHWVHRGAHAPGTPDLLVPYVESLALPADGGHGYLLGETRSMVALRALLESRGFAHDTLFVKGYWNIGRPDRIEGRVPQGLPQT